MKPSLNKKAHARGFTIIEVVVALTVLGLMTAMIVALEAAQLRALNRTYARISQTAETDQAVAVIESWINWSTRIDLVSAVGEETGGNSGSVLRLNLGTGGIGWVSLDNGGLTLVCPDGTTTPLSVRLRPDPATPTFQRSAPTSPWEDAPNGATLAYGRPFTNTGLVVISYTFVDDPTPRQRGFGVLGL